MTLRRVSFFDGFQSETTPVTVVIADREFRVGSGVPSAGLGNDTDNYLDYSTGNIYLKTSGTWGLIGTIDLQSVGGDFTVNGALDTTGNVDSGGSVSSTTTIDAGTDITAGGNLDINGTGESNIAGNLTVEGNLTVNGTTTTVNSTTLDVTDANITVNNGGDQATADLNDAGFTVEMSDATDATVHYDSTSATKFKVGEVGSTVPIVDESTSQTLTNKTLDLDNNTVSNIEVDNFKTGVVQTDISGSVDDTKIPTSEAVTEYVLAQAGAVVTEITTTYTILGTDATILADTSGGSYTVTLPSAVTVGSGKHYFISKRSDDFNELILDGDGTETIDGDLTKSFFVLNDYIYLVSDGANWKVISIKQQVFAKYRTNAGQLVNSGAGTVLVYEDLVVDTHSSYNTGTGVYTAPEDGLYHVSQKYELIPTANWVVNGRVLSRIFLGATEISTTEARINSGANLLSRHFEVFSIVEVLAGQQITVECFPTNNNVNLVTTDKRNELIIHKIG